MAAARYLGPERGLVVSVVGQVGASGGGGGGGRGDALVELRGEARGEDDLAARLDLDELGEDVGQRRVGKQAEVGLGLGLGLGVRVRVRVRVKVLVTGRFCVSRSR